MIIRVHLEATIVSHVIAVLFEACILLVFAKFLLNLSGAGAVFHTVAL